MFREYWIKCFEDTVDKTVSRAINSQPSSPTADIRAAKLKKKYIDRLQYYREQPL